MRGGGGRVITAIVAIVAAVGLAALTGWLLTHRAGDVRETKPGTGAEHPHAAGLGLSSTGPTIVHFTAAWCGQCTQVRRVVQQVCDDVGDVAHIEVDLDTDPSAAQKFSVLSLPVTLIFDADGRQRYRTAGVPKPADLRSALEPLLA
jgi:thiol-disulfide isomerase/thioredoxin